MSVSVIRRGPRSAVLRVELGEPAPRSVIIKTLDPDSPLGLTEWASLVFLAGRPATASLVPGVIGGDAEARVLVLEDLGTSTSLDDLLRGTDPVAIRTAVGALADRYAHLHAGTRGAEAEFGRVCEAIPGSEPGDRVADAEAWRVGLSGVRGWMAAVDVAEPAGFDDACQRVAAAFADPGDFLAFSHGDPAPTNNHIGTDPGDVRLLDFEYGGFRHALYDLTAWEILCPLPRPLVVEMVARYRRVADFSRDTPPETSEACDSAFDEAWATMAAYRGLAMLSWIPIETVDVDGAWVDEWTRRQAVLAVLGRLAAGTHAVAGLLPIATTARGLEAALRVRWPGIPADPIPHWPALRR